MEKFTFEDLISAIQRKNIKKTKEICETYPTLIEKVNNDHWGLIHFCAAYGTGEIMEYLLQKGVDIEQKTRENWTPLLLAAMEQKKECVQVLLRSGANIKAKSLFGDDLLSLLCENDKKLEKIVNCGLNLDIYLEKQGDSLYLKGTAKLDHRIL